LVEVVAGFSQQLGIFIAALDANLCANTAEIDKSCVNQIKGWGVMVRVRKPVLF
jgi:hypothetical protein